jgi:UDP-N-acetylglucosamine--N-acetylmuramyl-(pentapeptide) pyrophosphoryl-undecaprenol N-acetylglucosamine transferase
MKILSVGGGSGGHVTPVLAVLNELKRLDPKLEVQFVCDKRFAAQAREIMRGAAFDVPVHIITAGKLRRYHGVSVWKQLLDLPTTFRNIRDMVLVGVGTLQSVWLLWRWRPDVVFTKGGFVCLPVGVAARMFKIPLVIHDSDAHPGLTNRILARWARFIATGAPLEHYSYPESKARYTGIPIDASFKPMGKEQIKSARGDLGLPDARRPLVVVTGGGLGARRINQAMIRIAPKLIEDGLSVVHITGKSEFASAEKYAPESVHYKLVPFISTGMAPVLGAADVVVTRAGATTMLELASLAASVIVIPNAILTGGHQLKNAAVYEEADAAVVLDETKLTKDPAQLYGAITELVNNETERERLGKNLYQFARPDAALDVARLVVEAAAPTGEES